MKRVLIYVAFVSLTLVPMARAFRLIVTYSISGTAGASGWYHGNGNGDVPGLSGGRVGG